MVICNAIYVTRAPISTSLETALRNMNDSSSAWDRDTWGEKMHFIGGSGRNPSEIAALGTSPPTWGEKIHFIGGDGRNPSEIAALGTSPPTWGEKIHFIGGDGRNPSEIAALGASPRARQADGVGGGQVRSFYRRKWWKSQ